MADTVRGAFPSHTVTTFGTSADALSHLLGHLDSPLPLVVIDLQTVRDAEHLIGFLKASSLHGVLIAAIGTPEDYKSLSRAALASLEARFRSPLDAAELASMVATIRGRPRDGARPRVD